jgi:hypothetical protein
MFTKKTFFRMWNVDGTHKMTETPTTGYVSKCFGIIKRTGSGWHDWQVTHLPTGRRVGPDFSRLNDAKVFVTAAEEKFNWDRPIEFFQSDSDERRTMYDFVRDYIPDQPPLTLEQAKKLEVGTVLYDLQYRNSDGSPQRWKVNGKPKTWKTRPEQVKVPVKRGMYQYGYVTESTVSCFSLKEGRR